MSTRTPNHLIQLATCVALSVTLTTEATFAQLADLHDRRGTKYEEKFTANVKPRKAFPYEIALKKALLRADILEGKTNRDLEEAKARDRFGDSFQVAGGSTKGGADAGGGNLVDGELFDFAENKGSVEIDIESFKQMPELTVAMERIFALGPNVAYSLRELGRKTWYFEPKKITNSSCTNTSLVGADQEVAACQTDLEVRINARSFSKLVKSQQAALVIHELFVQDAMEEQEWSNLRGKTILESAIRGIVREIFRPTAKSIQNFNSLIRYFTKYDTSMVNRLRRPPDIFFSCGLDDNETTALPGSYSSYNRSWYNPFLTPFGYSLPKVDQENLRNLIRKIDFQKICVQTLTSRDLETVEDINQAIEEYENRTTQIIQDEINLSPFTILNKFPGGPSDTGLLQCKRYYPRKYSAQKVSHVLSKSSYQQMKSPDTIRKGCEIDNPHRYLFDKFVW